MLVAVFVLATGTTTAATPPKLTDLGALLPESGLDSFAVGINDRGQIVGMAFDPVGWQRIAAVVWQPGPSGPEAILLGDPAGPIHYELSIPDNSGGAQRAINRQGEIVGWAWGGGQGGGIIWREEAPGRFVPRALSGPAGTARAINGLSQIMGSAYYWADPSSGPVGPLPVPGGFFEGPDLYDINDVGQIVGLGYESQTYSARALLWSRDDQGSFLPEVLPLPNPSSFATASAINNHGRVVGYSRSPYQALAWEKKASGYVSIVLDPPAGCSDAAAFGINDLGQVAGVAACGGQSAAVLWTPDGTGVLKPAVLPADEFSGAVAYTLNNRGQIVGSASGCHGQPDHCGWNAVMWESDSAPPTIANVTADPAVLWPPSHKLADVTIRYDATDDRGSVDCTLGPVTSNEVLASSDWVILDVHHVRLMSERSGRAPGRTYAVPVICVDLSGNATSTSVEVVVPHDRR